MMPTNTPTPLRKFSAHFDAMAEALAEVTEICTAANIDNTLRLNAILVVEELFTNTVQYGADTTPLPDIWLSVTAEKLPTSPNDTELVAIAYHDSASAFNPLIGLNLPSSSPVKNKQLGGLGRALIIGLAARSSYRRQGNLNIIEIQLTKQDLPKQKSPA